LAIETKATTHPCQNNQQALVHFCILNNDDFFELVSIKRGLFSEAFGHLFNFGELFKE
jgi:hypothetical protein